MINFDKENTPDPITLGLPPVSREGLIDCDEYSPNYQKPCNEGGEDGKEHLHSGSADTIMRRLARRC